MQRSVICAAITEVVEQLEDFVGDTAMHYGKHAPSRMGSQNATELGRIVGQKTSRDSLGFGHQ